MIPLGYLLKKTKRPDGWTGPQWVEHVSSVAGCVNDDLIDPLVDWEQNDYGFYDSLSVLQHQIEKQAVDTSSAAIFYYEAYESVIDFDGERFDPEGWRQLLPADMANALIHVQRPPAEAVTLFGYDVVAFSNFPNILQTPQHSPLSCNLAADDLKNGLAVNSHCLFDTLNQAKQSIDQSMYSGCEDGMYTILSVAQVKS